MKKLCGACASMHIELSIIDIISKLHKMCDLKQICVIREMLNAQLLCTTCESHPIVSEDCGQVVMELYPNQLPCYKVKDHNGRFLWASSSRCA
jgi:hypothetical protein